MSQITPKHRLYAALCATLLCLIVMTYLSNRSKGYSKEQRYDEYNLEVLSQTKVSTNNLFKNLQDYVKSRKGSYSFVIKNLDSNETYAYNEKQVYYAASLYKTPVAVAALKEVEKGNINMTQNYPYFRQDYADGTGVLVRKKFGTNFTLEMLLNTLLKESDNVAQNILLRTLPKDAIKEAFSISPQENYLDNNMASTEEISNYFSAIYKGTYLSNENKAYLFDLLSSTAFDNRISTNLKKDVTFTHKIGSWPGNYHDCGIAFSTTNTYTICLMSGNADYNEFLDVSNKLARFFNTVDSL